MTVAELIDRLSEMDPEAQVRLATQPAWPLQFEVGDVVPGAETPADAAHDGRGPIVWLTEGGHPTSSPYAPASVFDY